MDFQALQKDILIALRGERRQVKISKNLGFDFNQVYRWETGVTQLRWVDFVVLMEVYKAPLVKALRESYSYFDNPKDVAKLVRHFVGKNSQVFIAEELQVSRSNVSRWLKGSLMPTVPQVFALMNFASPDFFGFVELLTGTANLPSIQEELQLEKKQAEAYLNYPWLSALLSAIGMDEYQKNPSEEFLALKSRLPLATVKSTLKGLEASGLLQYDGTKWVAQVYRNRLGISREAVNRALRFVMTRAADGFEIGGAFIPEMRYSYKLFSLNKKQYEKILQRYTEFFNELGTIIDEGQDKADKIYAFSMNLVDFDFLPEEHRRDFSKKIL